MREKLFNRKYIYIEITLMLTVAIVLTLACYTSYVQKNSVRQCFGILDDSRAQMGQMIANELNNEQSHIESASSLLVNLMPEYEKNKGLIVKIMEASSRGVPYSHWEICFPDGNVIQEDGSSIELGDKYSFDDRVSDEMTVSERRTAIMDDSTQIIMLSKSMYIDGECVGILSSVIDLEKFAGMFTGNSSQWDSRIVLFERGTGDVLIDEWNDDLGNVGAMKAPDMEKGYDWDSVSVDFRSGDSEHAAFRLSDGSETMYLSYAGIPYSDLELLVIAPGSVCMAAANNNKRGTYSMIIAIILEFGLFLTVILIEEKRRQRIMEGRRIQLEEALEKANAANAAKSRFLSKMSHDIRTPLNGIIGLIDISEANPDNLEMLEENRKKEKVAANHLLSLVNDVLNMSKLEEDKVELAHEAFDIRKLADDILTITQMRAEDAGVRLEHQDCKVNIPHPYVYGSPLHVRQIFVNILGNAIKYNKTGGSIITRIESGKCENGIIWDTCRIADTGIGMSSEFLEHLFDPFAQEKVDARSVYQGSGLGMSIAKSLIDKMGGTIEVKSEQGAGSEFVVTLPFEIATEESVRSEAFGDESASIDGVKILMAEDNELNREIAVELLREKGAVVTTVNDGQAAVDAVSKCGDECASGKAYGYRQSDTDDIGSPAGLSFI